MKLFRKIFVFERIPIIHTLQKLKKNPVARIENNEIHNIAGVEAGNLTPNRNFIGIHVIKNYFFPQGNSP